MTNKACPTSPFIPAFSRYYLNKSDFYPISKTEKEAEIALSV
jgi:hypothetical protein